MLSFDVPKCGCAVETDGQWQGQVVLHGPDCKFGGPVPTPPDEDAMWARVNAPMPDLNSETSLVSALKAVLTQSRADVRALLEWIQFGRDIAAVKWDAAVDEVVRPKLP